MNETTDIKPVNSEKAISTKIQTTYKDSPLGKIPIYWDWIELGEISDITSSKRIMLAEYVASGIPFYRSKEVIEKINGKEVKSEIHIPETTFRIIKNRFGSPEANQILMTAVGSLGQAYLIKESDLPFYFKDGNLLWLKNIDVKKVDINFLLAYFKSEYFKKVIDISTYGSSQKALTIENLNSFTIPIPPFPEQRAIAFCLTTIDETITKTNQLIAQKELRKKWLMQQLLSGKKRLKGFGGEWKEIHIRDISKEVSLRNNTDKQLTVLSCTKYNGLVPSLEYFGRKIFSDDISTYKIVPKNHFAYATNHIEEGSIGYQDSLDEALISPMYTVFKTDKSINDYFFFKLLKSHRLIFEYNARMEGSIDRRGGLRWDSFSIIKVSIPSLEEQTAIVQVLQAADKEIQLLKAKAEKLKEEKKGMMQVLLTGKKRLKIS